MNLEFSEHVFGNGWGEFVDIEISQHIEYSALSSSSRKQKQKQKQVSWHQEQECEKQEQEHEYEQEHDCEKQLYTTTGVIHIFLTGVWFLECLISKFI